jgi:SNF2 family DNA or RNA helicase
MTEKYIYKTQPYEHQRQALIKGAKLKNFAYFMEMGTGKTKVAIDNAAYLFKEKQIQLVIVIAPNSVYQNWIKEIETHCPVEDYNIFVHKVDKKFQYLADKLNFYLINVEAFSHQSGVQTLMPILLNLGRYTMMILDESTTIKNREAKRTKAICKLGTMAGYKRILTGSPITKSPLDLYTQCSFLSPSLLGFKSFLSFRNRYCMMEPIPVSNDRVIMIPKYFINLHELEDKLKSFSYRVRKEDCLDLPEKIYQQRFVEFTLEQKRVYKQMQEQAFAIIQDQEVSFANKLTEMLKLHQVCNGFLKTNEGAIVELEDCPKLKELIKVIEEGDGKFIIWANYIHNIESICKLLKKLYGDKSVVSIYGAVSVEDRTIAVNKFQSDPDVKFFVGNPTTGGYGLTLTAASYVVYFSNSYNLEVRQQSEDRAHRIGQKKNVTYVDILMRNSIDMLIVSALQRKIKISAETLGEEVKRWLTN